MGDVMLERKVRGGDLLIYESGDKALRAGTIDSSSLRETTTFGDTYLELIPYAESYGWYIGPFDFSKYSQLAITGHTKYAGNDAWVGYHADRLGLIWNTSFGVKLPKASGNNVHDNDQEKTIDISAVTGEHYIRFNSRYTPPYYILRIELRK